MNLEMLRKWKPGEQANCGLMFPRLCDEEVRWTVRTAVDMTREKDGKKTKARLVEFDLDYKGVSMGAVRAVEDEKGGVKWESMK